MSVGMVGRSRAWIWVPVGAILAVVGIALVAGLLYGPAGLSRGTSSWFPFIGFWAFLWVFIVFGVLRWFLWPGWGYRRGYWRGYWRGDEGGAIAPGGEAPGGVIEGKIPGAIRGPGPPTRRAPPPPWTGSGAPPSRRAREESGPRRTKH